MSDKIALSDLERIRTVLRSSSFNNKPVTIDAESADIVREILERVHAARLTNESNKALGRTSYAYGAGILDYVLEMFETSEDR